MRYNKGSLKFFMKIAIFSYSRSGFTRRLALKLAELLSADVFELIDKTSRSGMLGYLLGGRDASLARLTKLEVLEARVSDYDLVLIGGPVWAWSLSPAERTFLTEQKDQIKNYALFCTQGGSGADKLFKQAEEILGKPSSATFVLLSKEVGQVAVAGKILNFVNKIKMYEPKQ